MPKLVYCKAANFKTIITRGYPLGFFKLNTSHDLTLDVTYCHQTTVISMNGADNKTTQHEYPCIVRCQRCKKLTGFGQLKIRTKAASFSKEEVAKVIQKI